MLKLVLRNLFDHPARTILTAGSVAVAVALLVILHACQRGLESAVTNASANRLLVQSAVSLFVSLPKSYESKIRTIDGIDTVCKFQWFGGIYQDPANFFAQFGVDPERIDDCYPEMELVQGSFEAFARNRRGCIVAEALMEKFDWKLGDTVPIQGTIFSRTDGGAWEFEIEASYTPKTTALDANTMYFDFAFLDEALQQGDAEGPIGVGVYLVRVADGVDPEPVQRTIDELYEAGPQRVQTTTEAEFSRQFLTMLGNVPLMINAIGGAVLFAIFFAVLNTMLAAGRERIRQIGVVKAIGFNDGFVYRSLITESLLLCGFGGLLGIGLAKLAEGFLSRALAGTLQSFAISNEVAALGLGVAAAVGLLAGLAPCLSAGRMQPVEALRMAA